jgi:hypothetical protein
MTDERAAELLKRCDHIDEWRRMRPETPWKAGIDSADLRDLLAARAQHAEAVALLRRLDLSLCEDDQSSLQDEVIAYLTRYDAERQSGETP